MDLTKGTPQVAFSSNVIVHTPAGARKPHRAGQIRAMRRQPDFAPPVHFEIGLRVCFFGLENHGALRAGFLPAQTRGAIPPARRNVPRISNTRAVFEVNGGAKCSFCERRRRGVRRRGFRATSRPCTSRQTALRPLRSHTSRVAARWLAQGREREHYASNRWRCPQWLAALREASSARRR